jgi:hypothetical protein
MTSCLREAIVSPRLPFDRLRHYRHCEYAVNDRRNWFVESLAPCRTQHCGRRTRTVTPSCGPASGTAPQPRTFMVSAYELIGRSRRVEPSSA